MKNYFFSIVMPVYNRESFLEKSIQSVVSQTYPHFELIVVDDGSTDGSRQIINSMIVKNPKIDIHYCRKENGERGAARNLGANKASGEYLNFFDSDDLLYPNHLAQANALLNKQPKAQWFHLGYEIKNEYLEKKGRGPLLFKNANRKLISGNHLSCNGVFVDSEVFSQFRFNEDRHLAGMEDWELWLRLAAEYPLFFDNTISSCIIQHQSRSVMENDAEKLIQRVNLLMRVVENNTTLTAFMGKDKVKFQSSCLSYIALHLALMKNQKHAAKNYLRETLRLDPTFILKRRFYAILKRLQ